MLAARLDPKVSTDRYHPPRRATGKPLDALTRARAEAPALPPLWKAVVRRLFRGRKTLFDAADVLTVPRPRSLGCETINVCNANCSFCGYGKGADGKDADPRIKGKLDIEAMRHALKLYSDAGGGVFALEPILGEISADPRWLDLIREARSFPNIVGVSTYTNGILLHRFGYENILKSGLTVMNISTSLTSREAYRRLYGVDKYDQVVENVLGMVKANARLGFPVNLHILLRIDKPYSTFYESPLYAELIQHIDPKNISLQDDMWDDFKGVIKQDGLPEGHAFRPPVDKTAPCYAMFRKLQVLTDGTIQACACRVEPELWGGKITDYDSLKSAWRDPRIEELRNDWFDGSIPDCCKSCSHYQPYTDLIPDMSPPTVMKIVVNALKRRIVRLVA